MKFRGGEFSTGTTGNFQPELTYWPVYWPSREDQGYDGGNSLGARYTVIGSDASANLHVVIDVQVNEGPQFRLGGIQFSFDGNSDPGNGPFPVEQLRDLIPLREGDLVNRTKLYEGFQSLTSLYESKGYIDVRTGPFSLKFERGIESVTAEITVGRQYRVGDIEVLGLDPLTENKLRSTLVIGDIFNPQVIAAFYEDNRAILPPGASPRDVKWKRDAQNSIVDLFFDFLTLPRQQPQN